MYKDIRPEDEDSESLGWSLQSYSTNGYYMKRYIYAKTEILGNFGIQPRVEYR